MNDDLYLLFNKLPDDIRQIMIDSFASACWMHQQGQFTAGIKLASDILYHVELLTGSDLSELITGVINALPGNEKSIANSLPMRVEFKHLFGQI